MNNTRAISALIFTMMFGSSAAIAEAPAAIATEAPAPATEAPTPAPAKEAPAPVAPATAEAPAEEQGKKLSEKLAETTLVMDVKVDSCNADAAILCPGLPQNSKKSFMCLMAYEDNLSLGCKIGLVEAAMAVEMGLIAIEYSIEACEADADQYCADIQPGEGRIVSCLRENETKLKKECTTALKDTGLWSLGDE